MAHKNHPIFAVRVKTERPKKDWSKFIEAKKENDYTTAGKELEKALYEYMEREGWDFENETFIDFNDKDEDNFSNKHRHTHIEQEQDQKSNEESTDPAETPLHEIGKSGHKSVNHENIDNQAGIIASAELSEQIQSIDVKTPTNEEMFTYAFCKLYENMPEVHYEQIEQLSLPFFKIKEERAIKNKLNILIGNQCMVKKPSSKKWFKILPDGIQRFKTENSHLEEVLEKELSKDFLDALTP